LSPGPAAEADAADMASDPLGVLTALPVLMWMLYGGYMIVMFLSKPKAVKAPPVG
jgi:hypothetical protein